MPLFATRTVTLEITKPPTLDYLIKDFTTASGTGDPSFVMPNNIAAGDTIYAFLRLNKYVVNGPSPYEPDYGIFTLDSAAGATVTDAEQPYDVAWVRVFTRYSNGTEAGDAVNFDLTMFNGSGAGAYVDYDGEWNVVVVVLNGEYFTNGGYIDDNPEETNSNPVTSFGGYYPFSGTSVVANTFTFWAAAGYSSNTFNPSNFPTLIASSGNLSVWAKYYAHATTIAEGGMSFNGSGYFAATGLPLYVAG